MRSLNQFISNNIIPTLWLLIILGWFSYSWDIINSERYKKATEERDVTYNVIEATKVDPHSYKLIAELDGYAYSFEVETDTYEPYLNTKEYKETVTDATLILCSSFDKNCPLFDQELVFDFKFLIFGILILFIGGLVLTPIAIEFDLSDFFLIDAAISPILALIIIIFSF